MVKVAGETGLLHKLPHPTWGSGRHLSGPVGPHGLHQGEASWGGDDPHSRLEEPKAGGMSGQRHTVWGWGVEKGREVGGGSRVDR